jgi:NAD(P)H-flavin reductase
MADFARATVVKVSPATPTLTVLRISLDSSALAGGHVAPGQYVKLSVDGVSESHFAIASRPGSGNHFDFLVKGGSPVAEALAKLSPGDPVRVGAVKGTGFDLDRCRGADLLLAATGSGISAIRSVIHTLQQDRKSYGRVWLLFGARLPEEFAYADEFDRWKTAGIDVIPVVSQPGTTWDGRKGWVQAYLPEDLDYSRAWALLSGRKEMIRDMTEALLERGIPRDRILLNY